MTAEISARGIIAKYEQRCQLVWLPILARNGENVKMLSSMKLPDWSIAAVLPGAYTVIASKPGYVPVTAANVTVTGVLTNQNFQMTPG